MYSLVGTECLLFNNGRYVFVLFSYPWFEIIEMLFKLNKVNDYSPWNLVLAVLFLNFDRVHNIIVNSSSPCEGASQKKNRAMQAEDYRCGDASPGERRTGWAGILHARGSLQSAVRVQRGNTSGKTCVHSMAVVVWYLNFASSSQLASRLNNVCTSWRSPFWPTWVSGRLARGCFCEWRFVLGETTRPSSIVSQASQDIFWCGKPGTWPRKVSV